MVLTQNPDSDTYLLRFFQPKDLIYFGMTSKEARVLVRSHPIYLELIRLKFDKHMHRFDSYEIIASYYIHGMTNLITQHKLDHHRAVRLAAQHGHLDLLQFLYGAKHFPLATFSFHDVDTMRGVVQIIIRLGHYHITKWLAEIDIIDHWLAPTTICQVTPHAPELHMLCCNTIKNLAIEGNLLMLQHYSQTYSYFYSCWRTILEHAFAHGHINILDWLLDFVTKKKHGVLPTIKSHVLLNLPHQFSAPLLAWYWDNYDKFPINLYLYSQDIAILDQLHTCIHMTDNSWVIGDIIRHTILAGNLDLLKWLYDKNPYQEYIQQNAYSVLFQLISNNHLPMLIWLMETTPTITYNEYLVNIAIKTGHLSIIKWFWSKKPHLRMRNQSDSGHMYQTAYHGYLHILAWLKEHQLLSDTTNRDIMHGAISGGHLDIIKWLGQEIITKIFTDPLMQEPILKAIIKYGRVNILALLYEYNLITAELITKFATYFAVEKDEHNYLDIYPMVRWLADKFEHFDLYHVLHKIIDASIVVGNGSEKVRRLGDEFSEVLCRAISLGEWHVVQWVYERQSNHILSLNLKQKLDQYQNIINNIPEDTKHI